MNGIILLWASALGTAMQLAMVTIGHQVIQVKALYLWGGLLLSAVAGALYARASSGSWSQDLVAGCVAGGSCAFVGILISFLLGDVAGRVLLFGTLRVSGGRRVRRSRVASGSIRRTENAPFGIQNRLRPRHGYVHPSADTLTHTHLLPEGGLLVGEQAATNCYSAIPTSQSSSDPWEP